MIFWLYHKNKAKNKRHISMFLHRFGGTSNWSWNYKEAEYSIIWTIHPLFFIKKCLNGDLRFKVSIVNFQEENQYLFMYEIFWEAPEPIPRWNILLAAFEHGNTFLRPNVGEMDTFRQSEDCLYLNIYFPGRNEFYKNQILKRIHDHN